jgi:hypothetical protein
MLKREPNYNGEGEEIKFLNLKAKPQPKVTLNTPATGNTICETLGCLTKKVLMEVTVMDFKQ